MRKEIRQIDAERRIMMCTTVDERWYSKPEPNPATGLDRIAFRPSVTYIVGVYPKGKRFEQYLKANGFDADNIVQMAGEIGYAVHLAVGALNAGHIVHIDDKFPNQHTGVPEELSTEEWAGVCSYADWWHTEGKQRFVIEAFEFVTWPDAQKLAAETGMPADVFMFAGTIDLKVREIATGLIWIIDFKTSLDIYASHKMQVNAYRVAEGADRQAILQLNYRRNKTKKWKFTEIPDKFRLFRATMAIWREETEDAGPLQRDFPLELKLA